MTDGPASSSCPACGAGLSGTPKFCPECGERLAPAPAPAVEDELHPVTVLFADVVGSTGLGERLTPDQVLEVVGECTSGMVRAAEAFGGHLQALMGDGICVYFGVPAAHEDDPERAARAALRILDFVGEFAHEVEEGFGITGLSVRVGLNTGRTGLGLVGGAQRQLEALGDTTNVAARVQAAAEPGGIAVTEATAERLRRRFHVEPLGVLALKGREAPMPTWRLLGAHGDAEETAGRLTPFAGRAAEMATLEGSLAELRAGRGQVLCIVGEAGIGKSRLIHELRHAAGDEVAWLAGRCLSFGASMAYWPFVEALRGRLGVAESEAEVAVRTALKTELNSLLGPRRDEVLPYLARLLGLNLAKLGPEAEERVRHLPPEALADQIHRAYGLMLEALAQRGPVVVAVEDLQWADPSSRAMLESLLSLTERAAVLLVSDFRPETSSEAWRFRMTVQGEYPHRATELSLRPLPPDDAQSLAASLLPGSSGHPQFAAVVERAEGNPLFIEELAASLSDPEAGGAAPVGAGGAPTVAELPPVLEELLVALIDRLPVSARRLAQVAAIAGRSFLRRVIERVTAIADLDADLNVLIRANVIRELRRFPELEYIFTHGLAQEVAAATVVPSRRRELHGRVAGALEALLADDVDDHLDLLAHHWWASDDRRQALRWAERAGERACGLHAVGQARQWWERARAVATEVGDQAADRRLAERLADLLARMGSFQEGLVLFVELGETAADPDEAVRLLTEAVWAGLDQGAVDETVGLLDGARALESSSPETWVRLQLVEAKVCLRQERYADLGRVLVAIADPDALPPRLAARHAYLTAIHLRRTGDPAAATPWDSRHLELARALDDPIAVLDAQTSAAASRVFQGDLAAAAGLYREAHELARRVGYLPTMTKAGGGLLYVLGVIGDFDEAVVLGEALRDWAGSAQWTLAALTNLGGVQVDAGRHEEARATLTEAVAVAERLGNRRWGLLCRIALAGTDAGEGKLEEADTALRAAIVEATRGPDVYHECVLQARRVLAEVAVRRGDAEEAVRQAEEATAEASILKVFPQEQVPLWRLLGVARELRQPGTGAGALRRALDTSRALGLRIEEGRALAALAAHGLADDSEAARAEARRLFEVCGARRDLAELEESGGRRAGDELSRPT